MYGAILGDMIGSPYEFDRGGKTKDFPPKDPEPYGSYGNGSAMRVSAADRPAELTHSLVMSS